MVDRVFNTNEAWASGRTDYVLSLGVIVIAGYPDGSGKLVRQNLQSGDRVFAYASGQGMRALGRIIDTTIRAVEYGHEGRAFGVYGKAIEYQVRVPWDVVLPEEKAISYREMYEHFGFKPAIRQAVSRMNQDMGDWLEAEIQGRSN